MTNCLFSAQFHQIIERHNHPLPSQPILSIPPGSKRKISGEPWNERHRGGFLHSCRHSPPVLSWQLNAIGEMRENDERAVKFRIFCVAETLLKFILIERGAITEQRWTGPWWGGSESRTIWKKLWNADSDQNLRFWTSDPFRSTKEWYMEWEAWITLPPPESSDSGWERHESLVEG
jgi:hypothetical protein